MQYERTASVSILQQIKMLKIISWNCCEGALKTNKNKDETNNKKKKEKQKKKQETNKSHNRRFGVSSYGISLRHLFKSKDGHVVSSEHM